jgi:hypothetical protein
MSRRAGIAKARDCKNSKKTINCTKMPIKLPRRGLLASCVPLPFWRAAFAGEG